MLFFPGEFDSSREAYVVGVDFYNFFLFLRLREEF